MSERVIGVLVVDDHALVRRTLRAILDGQPDLRVIGEAGDGMEAIHLCQTVRPDVILMDVYMPRMDGIEAARRIRAIVPDSCIIGMSSDNSGWLENAFLSAGARAFLPKEMVATHLLQVIHRACSPELTATPFTETSFSLAPRNRCREGHLTIYEMKAGECP